MKGITFILIPFCVLFSDIANAFLIDRIVAVVGQEVITQSDLARPLPPHEREKDPFLSSSDPLRLRRLIEERVLFQAAQQKGMWVTDDELERALADMEQRNGFPNREAFKNAILASSLSWEKYLDALKTEITMAKMLHREIDSSLFITDQDARDYYERYPNRFGQADQIALDQILFSAAHLGWEAAQQASKEVQAEIEQGIPFDKIVEHHKEKAVPFAGMFKKSDLLPEVERVVFALEIGEISPVIKTSAGFHLFRVKEKITKGSFEASRPAIVSFLLNEKQNRLTRDWFSQLREQTFIEIK